MLLLQNNALKEKRCLKRHDKWYDTDDKMVPQGHHFGATYLFECMPSMCILRPMARIPTKNVPP